jgi:hypothetical protein
LKLRRTNGARKDIFLRGGAFRGIKFWLMDDFGEMARLKLMNYADARTDLVLQDHGDEVFSGTICV